MAIRKLMINVLFIFMVVNSLFTYSLYAASPTSSSLGASYGGEWVDKALVEVEDLDGTINLTFDKNTGKAALEYSVWDEENYTFQSTAPITVNEQKPVKFTYEYLDYTEHENPRTMRGEGIIEFKTGTIVLKMGGLPPDINKIFAQPRTFIRDPYANRVPKPEDAIAVVSQYCKCKESNLVKFIYPVADNESNKNWIAYVEVYVRGILLTEYKVNLHTYKATEIKDLWSQSSHFANKVKVSKITASSTLPKSKAGSYNANQVIDGDTATCWCEGVKGSGIGQSFTVSFPQKTEVSSLKVFPGYGKSVSAYLENNSVRKAKITFSDGTSVIADFTKESVWDLPKVKATTSITFTILEVNLGSKYNDTCVSEFTIS
ncbi:discoidin domain-containing protein [Paenibacillus sp. FSL H7-0357]|uniref:discoidin domain-containing protein n=2 Tax=Paenibacillus sp. FSL H7-0357 TaxID=1536774 RepID=UPI000AE887AE|nr:discoidin domain-containing protein [Paenibacillus sp. FSL H7-0357]